MKTIVLLASAVLASSQSYGGHGGDHGHGHGSWGHDHDWDWNGGYPHGGWGGSCQHMPGGEPPAYGTQNATFEQLIDHNNPELGTFSQFYFYDDRYWKGPGSPVILFTPGEVNATRYYSYLSTNRTTGLLAEEIGAATIVLEHRYWGVSSPFADLTTENMKYLTLDNALKDMTYFANNVKLPFAKHASSNAKDVPWVTMGGSYSGALSAWLASVEPGTLWAYHASSAPVEAVSDYWGYFKPVQEGMPQNCSKDVSLVIDHMDDILMHGSDQEVHDLKAKFGLETVEHNDDFMAALENGPWLWQGNQFYTNTGFFTWCDYVEDSVNKTGSAVAGPDGVGVEKALEGYAKWWVETELPTYCSAYGYAEFNSTNNTACLDSYNATSPLYTDTTLSNVVDRQWVWMTCNESFAYWQTGAPEGRPSIVSRLVTPEYWIRQCGLYFPPGPNGETYGIAEGKTEEQVNAYTGGWNIDNTTRLIYVNGDNDPWRECGVSADLRPGGPLESTEQVPVEIVPGGYHTSDLITQNGAVNSGVKAVQDRIIAQLAAWVKQYPKKHCFTA
ncbi:putative extracellular serine carboxypeptidase [Fulvia fulva]|uniref:Extracellular serine carboxypeptidase n=1 Tax=Passalora fulva TaxID=5499 RepID=A0A9Q8P849_PASFU|nr:putative extracellular serine carboxypeptidase [Fulvia fulva]KAK4616337.1 putative extracellular serine carboxypeptidase [Fulvia fulva]KAK4617392.1 putative extracellular serine carboxypeptidase [Fulvia fulva]UJO16708.1 putative extracellular serine carboxypeptidase [Fulvia fulva]WPV19181.1 putative extracellular serine carboxypeptidase [Fulvia fulva]WPV33926.1 putative extracellular serine carboxypeptidase [Fulvia fulva]